MGSIEFDPSLLGAEQSVEMLDMLKGLNGSLSDIHIVSAQS
jgi:hypothetical protein